jgi:hypothetical protein
VLVIRYVPKADIRGYHHRSIGSNYFGLANASYRGAALEAKMTHYDEMRSRTNTED